MQSIANNLIPTPFSGLDIIVVEAGTEIDFDGQKAAVTDKQAVRKGRKLYVTQPVYDKIKAAADKNGD